MSEILGHPWRCLMDEWVRTSFSTFSFIQRYSPLQFTPRTFMMGACASNSASRRRRNTITDSWAITTPLERKSPPTSHKLWNSTFPLSCATIGGILIIVPLSDTKRQRRKCDAFYAQDTKLWRGPIFLSSIGTSSSAEIWLPMAPRSHHDDLWHPCRARIRLYGEHICEFPLSVMGEARHIWQDMMGPCRLRCPHAVRSTQSQQKNLPKLFDGKDLEDSSMHIHSYLSARYFLTEIGSGTSASTEWREGRVSGETLPPAQTGRYQRISQPMKWLNHGNPAFLLFPKQLACLTASEAGFYTRLKLTSSQSLFVGVIFSWISLLEFSVWLGDQSRVLTWFGAVTGSGGCGGCEVRFDQAIRTDVARACH